MAPFSPVSYHHLRCEQILSFKSPLLDSKQSLPTSPLLKLPSSLMSVFSRTLGSHEVGWDNTDLCTASHLVWPRQFLPTVGGQHSHKLLPGLQGLPRVMAVGRCAQPSFSLTRASLANCISVSKVALQNNSSKSLHFRLSANIYRTLSYCLTPVLCTLCT